MSSDDSIQKTIREAKDILVNKDTEAFISFVEEKVKDLEIKDQILESIILWQFVAEILEGEKEEDYEAYAYSKLISRYLLMEDDQKAKECYDKSIEKELSSFHLNTVRTIYERRSEEKSKREIIQINKMDVFGDFVEVPASPIVTFETVSQIRRYAHNNLPEGTYSLFVYNHKNEAKEEVEISTEKLVEYEVISLNEVVRVD